MERDEVVAAKLGSCSSGGVFEVTVGFQGLVEAGSISDRCLHQGPGKSPIKVWIEVGLGVWVVVGVGVRGRGRDWVGV